MKEAYNLVIQIGDPRVQPFLDERRFVQSSVFADAVGYAIGHYQAHGDRGQMVRLWQLYSGPAARRRLNERFFSEAGVQCSLVQGQIHFDAAPSPTAVKVDRPAAVSPAPMVHQGQQAPRPPVRAVQQGPVASLRAPQGKKSVAPNAPAKEKKKKHKKIDLLDSWARVSGCYGSGKRR